MAQGKEAETNFEEAPVGFYALLKEIGETYHSDEWNFPNFLFNRYTILRTGIEAVCQETGGSCREALIQTRDWRGREQSSFLHITDGNLVARTTPGLDLDWMMKKVGDIVGKRKV